MPLTIALVGNPNCGKTTLFNNITNSRQKIGNWPGVTVEKKISNLKNENDIKIIDLPGIYSIFPYSPDEKVSSNFIIQNKPDVIINVVSAVNLERELYLTLQLLELKIPIVIAVSMLDLINKKGDFFDIEKFSQIFNCEVVKISKNGYKANLNLIEKAKQTAKHNFKHTHNDKINYNFNLKNLIFKVIDLLKPEQKNKIENLNWLALNLLEENEKFYQTLILDNEQRAKLKTILDEFKHINKESFQKFIISSRYNFISENLHKFYKKNQLKKISISDKIDCFLLNRWLAIPFFIILISATYFVAISLIGKPISDWLDSVLLKRFIISNLYDLLNSLQVNNKLTDLICTGLVNGVGSVLVFIPQLFILFLLLSFIEECGYMSRIAFITDKLFNKFGLCGQSVISFLVSSSCGVNGALTTKTIKNPLTRFITLATTTFVPCSAKIPVIAAISSLFFKHSWIIAPIAYCISFIAIFLCSFCLNYKHSKKQENQFLMEITPYQLPSIKTILIETFSNIKSFILKAGSIVLLASIFIWCASNLAITPQGFAFVKSDKSILATMAKIITPIFIPLGFANWQTSTAILTGLIAKENIVNTLEVLSSTSIISNEPTNTINLLFNNQACALSFLVFNLLCIPCCVALVAIHKQTGSITLTLKIIAIQTLTAYFFATIVFFVAKTVI